METSASLKVIYTYLPKSLDIYQGFLITLGIMLKYPFFWLSLKNNDQSIGKLLTYTSTSSLWAKQLIFWKRIPSHHIFRILVFFSIK